MTKALTDLADVRAARVGTIVRTHEGHVYELADRGRRVWLALEGRVTPSDELLTLPAFVLWEPEPEPIVLPTEPGTVIAIGEWWFVRLRPYKPGITPAWELLPAPEDVEEKARRNGFPSQCIYPDDIVLGEINQEGAFRIVAAPQEPAE